MNDDSRITRARSLISAAELLLAAVGDEIVSDPLEAARVSLNVSLCHLKVLEA